MFPPDRIFSNGGFPIARYVKISALCPEMYRLDAQSDIQCSVEYVISFWEKQLKNVLLEKPDLIVLPETCDSPFGLAKERFDDYYDARGSRVRNCFAAVAREYRTNIIYPSIRLMPDGSRRNAQEFIDREGGCAGYYHKNYVVISEKSDDECLRYGRDAVVHNMDIGRVGGIICFDLNFEELKARYASLAPELMVFSSMYHGGLMQRVWAYTCGSYFVGAVWGKPGSIINPVGCIEAASCNHTEHVTACVNMDYAVVHLAYGWDWIREMKRKFGPGARFYDPGHLGPILITSDSDEFNVQDILREMSLIPMTQYFEESLSDRHVPGHIER